VDKNEGTISLTGISINDSCVCKCGIVAVDVGRGRVKSVSVVVVQSEVGVTVARDPAGAIWRHDTCQVTSPLTIGQMVIR